MSNRDIFALGCKLLGIYSVVTAVPFLVGMFQLLDIASESYGDFAPFSALSTAIMWLVPISLIMFGLYLMKDGEYFHNMAFPDDDPSQGKSFEGYFVLSVKIFGLFFLIDAIPDLLRLLSSYILYSNAPQYMEMFTEKKFTYLNFLSTIAQLLLSIYMLKDGRAIVSLATQKQSPTIE